MTKREMVIEYLQSHPKATAREVAMNTTASLNYVNVIFSDLGIRSKAVALDIAGKCNPGKGCRECPFDECKYKGNITPEETQMNKAAWESTKRRSNIASGRVRHGSLAPQYSNMEYADFWA